MGGSLTLWGTASERRIAERLLEPQWSWTVTWSRFPQKYTLWQGFRYKFTRKEIDHILHLYKMFRMGKSIEVESNLEVAWGGDGGNVGGEWGVTASGNRGLSLLLFWNDKML